MYKNVRTNLNLILLTLITQTTPTPSSTCSANIKTQQKLLRKDPYYNIYVIGIHGYLSSRPTLHIPLYPLPKLHGVHRDKLPKTQRIKINKHPPNKIHKLVHLLLHKLLCSWCTNPSKIPNIRFMVYTYKLPTNLSSSYM